MFESEAQTLENFSGPFALKNWEGPSILLPLSDTKSDGVGLAPLALKLTTSLSIDAAPAAHLQISPLYAHLHA